MSVEMIYYDWTPDSMLEVLLPEPDNFLKIRETLTRIGIASRKEQKLYQSCHILHKQGRYFIVHFKELFALDGKESNITSNDVERRNTVAGLLQDWGLLKIVDNTKAEPKVSLSQIKVVAYKEKAEWELVPKYNIGKKITTK
jgi:Bacteriophage translational regulator